MAETGLKLIAILFTLICLSDGRMVLNVRPRAGSRYKEERLSEAEYSTYSLQQPNGPGTYAFGYDNVIDPSGNEQFRSEEKLQNGTVVGEYGYTDFKNHKIFRVSYTADERGYRAKTEVLPLETIY